MGWNTILFDLDGTLTDPKEGITAAVAYALAHFHIHVEDRDTLTKFIGPPLTEAFPEFYGFDPEQAVAAADKFREYFSRQGWRENVPYPGMAALLQRLNDAGKRLAVATSKPEDFALRILEHFGLAQYFTCICGAPMNDPDRARKDQVIADALARLEIADPAGTVMVGDRKHDVLGARAAGLPAIGVLYGYGSREELEAAGAAYIAEDLAALAALLM